MLKEFEGKTEKEAIDRAIDELGIDREEFDVEIVETSKKGIIFKKGSVKIRGPCLRRGFRGDAGPPAGKRRRRRQP